MKKVLIPMPALRPGTICSRTGACFQFSAAQLEKIAANYSPGKYAAKVQVGHDEAIANYGEIHALRFENGILTPYAELSPEGYAHYVTGFDDISLGFFPPAHPNNPTPGEFYPQHLAFVTHGAAKNLGDGQLIASEFAEFELTQEVFAMSDNTPVHDAATEKVAPATPDAPVAQFSDESVQKLIQEAVASERVKMSAQIQEYEKINEKVAHFAEVVGTKLPSDRAKTATALYKEALKHESGFAQFSDTDKPFSARFSEFVDSLPAPNTAMFQEVTGGQYVDEPPRLNLWSN